jgi:hypothetical protein
MDGRAVMLEAFVAAHREEIINLCQMKAAARALPAPLLR